MPNFLELKRDTTFEENNTNRKGYKEVHGPSGEVIIGVDELEPIDQLPNRSNSKTDDDQRENGGYTHSPGDPLGGYAQDKDAGEFEHDVKIGRILLLL